MRQRTTAQMRAQKGEPPLFGRVALIGLGLMGASLALSMKRGNIAKHIAGAARSQKTLARAKALRLVDSLHAKPQTAVKGAELIILCTPVGAFESVFKAFAPALAKNAILSDVGSVKQSVLEALLPLMPEGVDFIPAHPIAGTEKSGPDAGFAELFDGHWCILTPPPKARAGALQRMKRFWKRCGAQVVVMEAAHHDRVLALTSHLPHLIAYAMTDMAAGLQKSEKKELMAYSAGGFRDFTRLASSDPVMWRDIFLANQGEALGMLEKFLEHLHMLRQELMRAKGDALEARFRRAAGVRRKDCRDGSGNAAGRFWAKAV